MAKQGPAPRKRRTREHVIADLSLNHVERFILEEGHTAERKTSDYGYDLTVSTFDPEGHAEEGLVYFQFKASEKLPRSGDDFIFDIEIRDYNLWAAEPMPVILILFDAPKRRAYWVYVQRYFAENSSAIPKPDAKTVRVRIPESQIVSRRAVRQIRECKQAVLKQMRGVDRHER